MPTPAQDRLSARAQDRLSDQNRRPAPSAASRVLHRAARLGLVVWAAALLPAGAASAQTQAPDLGNPPEAAGPRGFVLGDSHVEMLGPLLNRRLAESGHRMDGYVARRGWSTARYRREADLRDVLESAGRPELLIVSLGGNDRTRCRRRFRANLEWVVREARAAGAREIVWIGPAESDAAASARAAMVAGFHERNANWQAEMLPAMGVRFIDSRPLTHEHHRRDGVHFDRLGYASWSRSLLSTLKAAAFEIVAAADASERAPEPRAIGAATGSEPSADPPGDSSTVEASATASTAAAPTQVGVARARASAGDRGADEGGDRRDA